MGWFRVWPSGSGNNINLSSVVSLPIPTAEPIRQFCPIFCQSVGIRFFGAKPEDRHCQPDQIISSFMEECLARIRVKWFRGPKTRRNRKKERNEEWDLVDLL